LKILYIVSTYPSENTTAGNFYQRTAEALEKLGVEVCVICFVPKTFSSMGFISKKWKEYYRLINQDEMINGVRVVRLGYFGLPLERIWARPNYFMFKNAFSFIERKKIEFDIIEANYAFPYCVVGKMLAEVYDKPLIATLRGSDVNVDAFRGWLGRNRFISGIKNANRIHVVSTALKEKVESIYPNNRTMVLPIGLDLNLINKIKDVNKQSAKKMLDWNGFHIIFVGSLTFLKGLDLIILLINNPKYKEITWHFIGTGQYHGQLTFYKNVVVHNHLDYESTLKLIYISDLLILPSRGEGMPNVIKEAGALETPVLASDVGGIPQILDYGLNGTIFKTSQIIDLENNLNRILENYSIAKEKAKHLMIHVYKTYDIDKNAKILKDVYLNELID